MRCVFSARALDDLREIGDYIARDSPERALRFVRQLREHCEHIVLQPLAAPLRPEFGEGVRMLPHGNYIVFYSVTNDIVLIERVIHGARDLPSLLEPDR